MSLVIEKLSAAYDGHPVFEDLSLTVNPSEPTGIVGPNGAGKTTLFRAVMSLVPVKKGKVKFRGVDITALPAHEIVRQGITLIPEGRQVFGKMTVRENLEVGAHTLKSSRKVRARLDGVFETFPLFHGRQDQFAGSLSGGEQQLLVIARGLMSNPTLLLVDEPFLGLAPAGIRAVRHALSEINAAGVGLLITEESRTLLDGLITRTYELSV